MSKAKFSGPGELERTGYIPPGSSDERERNRRQAEAKQMAESVKREEATRQAWINYWMDGDDENWAIHEPPNPYFVAGFNAAWDALMKEIRPLVAELHAIETLISGRMIVAQKEINISMQSIERLRELVREAGQ